MKNGGGGKKLEGAAHRKALTGTMLESLTVSGVQQRNSQPATELLFDGSNLRLSLGKISCGGGR